MASWLWHLGKMQFDITSTFYLSALMLLVQWQEWQLGCKNTVLLCCCWWWSDWSFAHKKFQLSPVPLSPSTAAGKPEMVWHPGTGLPRLSWKLAVRTHVVVVVVLFPVFSHTAAFRFLLWADCSIVSSTEVYTIWCWPNAQTHRDWLAQHG